MLVKPFMELCVRRTGRDPGVASLQTAISDTVELLDSMMCLTVNDIIRLRADNPIVLGNSSVADVREWALDAVAAAPQPTAAKRQRR